MIKVYNLIIDNNSTIEIHDKTRDKNGILQKLQKRAHSVSLNYAASQNARGEMLK